MHLHEWKVPQINDASRTSYGLVKCCETNVTQRWRAISPTDLERLLTIALKILYSRLSAINGLDWTTRSPLKIKSLSPHQLFLLTCKIR